MMRDKDNQLLQELVEQQSVLIDTMPIQMWFLSGERTPGFDTILKVRGVLGLKLHAEAIPVAGAKSQDAASVAGEKACRP